MTHKNEVWAIVIVVAAGAAILVYFAARAIVQVVALGNGNNTSVMIAAGDLSGVDTSGWQTYHDASSGFSVHYPPNWHIYTGGLSADTPFIVLGNPLSGMTTYAMDIFIEQNPQALSSGEYVHQLLSADRAQDAANAKDGPAPTVTPRFEKGYLTTAGSIEAYELYGVFEFDHDAERVYVAHGTTALRFDFPVSDANPNIASPANNNVIAHMIMNTLVW